MSRPFTVYFDTNFFVQLCKAEDTLARKIIEDINALEIRLVLSDVIMRELVTSSDRTERDKLLVERVGMFHLQHYRTDNYSDWNMLLSSGQQRVAIANFFRTIDDMTTVAESWGIVARQTSPSKEPTETYSMQEGEISRELLQQAEQTLSFLTLALNLVKETCPDEDKSLPDLSALESIKISDDAKPEDLKSISNHLFELLGEANIKKIKQQNELQDSVVNSEQRPQQVTTGKADSWTRKKLANTLRDAKHMDVFVSHRNEIDLLQVDKPQWNLIKNTNPKHYLVEIGLAERCFHASTLETTIEAILKLKNHR
jgi:hypothetical protein